MKSKRRLDPTLNTLYTLRAVQYVNICETRANATAVTCEATLKQGAWNFDGGAAGAGGQAPRDATRTPASLLHLPVS